MDAKVEHAQRLIAAAVKQYPRIAVACSFGKDSMVVTHLARDVCPDIAVFSIMTLYKPVETFEYLRAMNLGVTIYMVADEVPEALRDDSLTVVLLPTDRFRVRRAEIESMGEPMYRVVPDECCQLLKVEPTKVAVRGLDAWICGLRSTEGMTRTDFREVEIRDGLAKINPILSFAEADVWRYIATRGIRPHPWYGRGYRSLGCAPCSAPGGESERSGRWKGTDKAGGECGIHTQGLRCVLQF